jgi:hypothetical protein
VQPSQNRNYNRIFSISKGTFMPAIHLIERGDYPQNLVRLDREHHEWESGNWYLKLDKAEQLVGGMLYLHEAQDVRSRFGGKILSVREIADGADKGRVVFRFQAQPAGVDIRAGRDNWSQEMKIVWEESGD